MTDRFSGDAVADRARNALGGLLGGRHRSAGAHGSAGRNTAGQNTASETTGAQRPGEQEEVAVTDSAIGGVPTSGTDVAGDDDRSSTDGAAVQNGGAGDGPDQVIEGVLEDTPPAPAADNGDSAPADSAELERLRRELDERTADLQRVSAEYANYRRRVERDREATVASAKASVAGELLTVLDDVDRAGTHGDLTGPFKVVADRLTEVLHRVGLQPFGAEGDAFDPAVHEAVAQETSAEVSGPTVTTVMRRGYRFADRVLRPAMVAVTDRDPDAVPGAGADLPESQAAGSPGAINPDAT